MPNIQLSPIFFLSFSPTFSFTQYKVLLSALFTLAKRDAAKTNVNGRSTLENTMTFVKNLYIILKI